jgi:ribonucleotide reductase alpha subunit
MEKSKTFSNDFDDEMLVKKRNGELETVAFDKILRRIRTIGTEVGIKINYTTLAMKVIDQLYNGISTTKIDELSAQQCASLASTHPDYNVLAGRITISNHHKNTSSSFVDVMTSLYDYKDTHGKSSPLVSDLLYEVVQKYKDEWDNILDYQCDYLIDYFGFKTLERAYLMQINKVTVERPQHMWLRVSIGIHGDNLEQIRKTYEYMSQKYFTHATPTLFNAGTPHPQLSSCFLLAMEKDSIEGIYNTLKDCALISKWAGGIGLHIHNIRASGSHIRGTNGSSNGIVPMLKVFNNTAKYVDQCLDPDTIVYTKRGPIKIKNIVIGDKVVADDGNYYPIGKVLDNEYLGDLYTLDVKHTLYPLKLTDMHPLWTIKNDKCYQRNFDDVINQLDRNLLVPQFIEVKNISKNDFIGFPIPKYEKDIPQYTEDDCRFYGILLGDGNISISKNIAYVALNKETKQDTIEFVENYLQKINAHITYTYQNDKYVRLTWSRNNMFKFTYEMLYDNNKEKFVMPSMLHLSKPKILQIIKGILETDGKVKDYQIVLELTSNNIVESVRYMLLRLGILCSGTMRDRRNENHITKYNCFIQNKKISYILIVPKKPIICDLFKHKNISPSESFTFFEYEDYLFSIVDGNTFVKDYSGRVIDIEVDNDDHHNFLTHNGLVKNGGGKRNGSFAIYLEPWHADIELFLQMRKNHGDEELKARDLFYALWVPDLFMERIKTDGKWTLMCPDECPGLADVYGDDFANLYMKYEANGKGKKTVKARDLWFQILDAQMETGTPYLLYKDACNKKSNQKNVGTIKSSNLCVAPETQILTENGYFEIQSLHNQTVNIWNGEEFSEVTIHKTGENQELIDVYTNDGCKLTCTKYHKFFIQKSHSIEVVESRDLSIGDIIIEWKNIDNTIHPSVKIEKIVDEGRIDDTYCFNEPKKHAGIFNGIITSQCTEILEYSDENETAVCNLASIGLPTFVDRTTTPPTFNYEKLHEISQIVTYNLNRIIDVNYYPTPKTERSNKRHRPIGIGVQGLADVFMMMNLPFSSDEAKMMNKMIFETIYHGALTESCNIAKIDGKYETFDGSPASHGELQFDLWNVEPCTNRYDWTNLKNEIKEHGLRNSLLLAPMPTASTSQILGFNECIEPITSNIYSRRTIAGEFILANKYLMNDLIALDLWNEKIKNNIIANHGSIQHLEMIPQEIKEKYKTVWEIPMRNLIDMAADRGAYICQSQSLNLWLEDPNYSNLTSMHFYSWSKGLKTGIYYLRRRGRHQAQQFTIEPEKKESGGGEIEEDEICEMCSA